jgi:phospholipase C
MVAFKKTNNLRTEELMITHIRKVLALSLSSTLFLSGCGTGLTLTPLPVVPTVTSTTAQAAIQHIVVIFPENISFDHYFGTYPNAANLPTDKVQFTAATGTPIPDNYVSNPSLLTANPNLSVANNGSFTSNSITWSSEPSNPFRLDILQAATEDQDHAYGPEQEAFDGGRMDLFPYFVGSPDQLEGATAGTPSNLAANTGAPAQAATNALTMGYFDGNTVTGMWNYAQHYALNDHSFGTTFGASTQGAINLISGQTNGAVNDIGAAGDVVADGNGGYTDIGDADPTGDICSSTTTSIHMTGKNIGDLLNAANVTWGWFQGGFNLTVTNSNGSTGCTRSTTSAVTGVKEGDYIQHHEPFQYYATTQNLNHTRPTAGVAIGAADPKGANHQYDILDFNAALTAGSIPAVSFLKAPGYQDGHAGYSDPIDEQNFIVSEINAIEASPLWANTAIIIAYDDSDGWYDHVNNFVNGSQTASDSKFCNGTSPTRTGVTSGTLPVQGLCGFGPRLPLLVISPWAKANYIDSTVTDQSSVTRFIEDVFLNSTRIGGGSYDAEAGTLNNMFNFSNVAAPPSPNNLQLSPTTGQVVSTTAP